MLTRRTLVLMTVFAAAPWQARAASIKTRMDSEVALFAMGRTVERADIGFVLPESVESGYTVPASVDWPDPADPILDLRLLAPLNPLVRVSTLRFGTMAAGRCQIRIRLARTQTVTALARTVSGRVLRQDRTVAVLIGGCGFDLESPT